MRDLIGEQTLETMSQATWYNSWLFGVIKPWATGEIADVGAGIGNFLELYKKNKLSVMAIDMNSDYLKKIKSQHPTINTFQLDLESKSLPTGLLSRFDTVISLNVLEHVSNISQALLNIKSMLKPGGQAVILVPSFSIAYSKLDKNLGHVKRYQKKEFIYLATRAGLLVVKSFYLNFFGLLGWFFFGKILKAEQIPKTPVSVFDSLFRPFLKIEELIHPPVGLSLICVLKKP